MQPRYGQKLQIKKSFIQKGRQDTWDLVQQFRSLLTFETSPIHRFKYKTEL